MEDQFAEMMPFKARPTAARPLMGVTILLVEDSKCSSDAVRLLSLRSGARFRRADCRSSARRHLSTYRPSVAIIDIGLPDGSGLELIRDLAAARPISPIILATSGEDPALWHEEATDAGADGVLDKPLADIRAFQNAILKLLPQAAPEGMLSVIPFQSTVSPDPLSAAEDLAHAQELLTDPAMADDVEGRQYCAQFLRSVAVVAGDPELEALAGEVMGGAGARPLVEIARDLAGRAASVRPI